MMTFRGRKAAPAERGLGERRQKPPFAAQGIPLSGRTTRRQVQLGLVSNGLVRGLSPATARRAVAQAAVTAMDFVPRV
jgi:hypothetical protein